MLARPLKEEGPEADFLLVAAHDLPNFDPRVIERFATDSRRRALPAISTGRGSMRASGFLLSRSLAAVLWLACLSATAAETPVQIQVVDPRPFGYVVGDTRSALCRLQGQTALAQVEGAKHARAMAEAMREIHEIHEQLRGLTVAPAAPAAPAAPEPAPEQSPFNLPSVPALRVATGGSQVKPPPLSPPS